MTTATRTRNTHEWPAAITLGLIAGAAIVTMQFALRAALSLLAACNVYLPSPAHLALMFGVPTACMAAPMVWAMRPRRRVARAAALALVAWVSAVALTVAIGCWFKGSLRHAPPIAAADLLAVSAVILTIAAALAFAIGALVRRRGHATPGVCPSCGYDLSGVTAGRCPECGWSRDDPAPPRTERALARAAPVLIALVLALFVGAQARWWLVFGRARAALRHHGATRLIGDVAMVHGLAGYVASFNPSAPLPVGTAALFPPPEPGLFPLAVIVADDAPSRPAPQLAVATRLDAPGADPLVPAAIGPTIPLTPAQYRAILADGLPDALRRDLGRADLPVVDRVADELSLDLAPYLGP